MEMLAAASDRAFGDGFSVDDLLIEPEGSDDQEAEEAVSSGTRDPHAPPASSSPAASSDQLPQNPAVELDLHAEDGAELEWLSRFVDDSFSEFPSYGSENNYSQSDRPSASPKTNLLTERRFTVPVRARSKRSRKLPSSCAKSPAAIALSRKLPSACAKSPAAIALGTEPTKERKKRSDARCGHCGVEETPQWRAGPTGAKTLCNACGVRFKSGRLLPEYRPACSPTFVSGTHSNCHRKVLELRRNKAEEEERAAV